MQRAVHVPPALRSILHAEALAVDQSRSALVRERLEERLDLRSERKRREDGKRWPANLPGRSCDDPVTWNDLPGRLLLYLFGSDGT